MANFQRVPHVSVECTAEEYEKIAIFDEYLILSWK